MYTAFLLTEQGRIQPSL